MRAQEFRPPVLVTPAEQRKLTLSLTETQAQFIVQTLGAISCQTVATLATCMAASEMIKEIRDQVIAQQPK